MSRSSLMLATLQRARGGWVSRAELFNDAGCHYLSNNASSELRPKGYEVEHKIVRGLHSYRLVSSGGSGAVALGTVPHQQPPGSLSEGVHDRSGETSDGSPCGRHADGARATQLPSGSPEHATDSPPPSLSEFHDASMPVSSLGFELPPERSAPSPGATQAAPQLSLLEDVAA